jgi:hypothetical protein
MDHRRFLAHPEAHRPFASGDLFARIGGSAAIDTLVDGLYDGIEVDVVLGPLFGRDLATERESQKRFFTDWLGGEGNYRPYLPLKDGQSRRSDPLPIPLPTRVFYRRAEEVPGGLERWKANA